MLWNVLHIIFNLGEMKSENGFNLLYRSPAFAGKFSRRQSSCGGGATPARGEACSVS